MTQPKLTRDDVSSMIGARRELEERLALAIVSLGTGIPITAIAAQAADALGIAIAWIGIAAVNLTFSRRRG